MEFYFRVAKQYFTNELSEWVKYCFRHEKIKFISSSLRIMFFLLYRQKGIDKIIDFNSPKGNCDGSNLHYSNIYRTLFTIILRNNTEPISSLVNFTNLLLLLLAIFIQAMFASVCNNAYKFRREITEIRWSINSPVRLWKINHSGPGCRFYEFYEWYIFQ